MSADPGERGGVSPPSEAPPGESQTSESQPSETQPSVVAPNSLGGLTPPRSPKPTNRRRLFLVAGVLGVLAGFATWFVFIREREPKNDAERLRGDWQIAIAGRDTPNAVIVTGDRWEHQGGKAYRVTLNEATDPREITLELVDAPKLKGPAVTMHGVYAFESNNKVRIRVAPGTQPRPKSLDDPDAPEWVLTRVKLEPVPEPGR